MNLTYTFEKAHNHSLSFMTQQLERMGATNRHYDMDMCSLHTSTCASLLFCFSALASYFVPPRVLKNAGTAMHTHKYLNDDKLQHTETTRSEHRNNTTLSDTYIHLTYHVSLSPIHTFSQRSRMRISYFHTGILPECGHHISFLPLLVIAGLFGLVCTWEHRQHIREDAQRLYSE